MYNEKLYEWICRYHKEAGTAPMAVGSLHCLGTIRCNEPVEVEMIYTSSVLIPIRCCV